MDYLLHRYIHNVSTNASCSLFKCFLSNSTTYPELRTEPRGSIILISLTIIVKL